MQQGRAWDSWFDRLTADEKADVLEVAMAHQRRAIVYKALAANQPVPYTDEWFERILGPLSREPLKLMLIDFMRAQAGLPPAEDGDDAVRS